MKRHAETTWWNFLFGKIHTTHKNIPLFIEKLYFQLYQSTRRICINFSIHSWTFSLCSFSLHFLNIFSISALYYYLVCNSYVMYTILDNCIVNVNGFILSLAAFVFRTMRGRQFLILNTTRKSFRGWW